MTPLPESVLGIDLSLTSTGLAGVRFGPDGPLFETQAVRPTLRGWRRRRYLVRKVALVAEGYDVVGLEAPAFGMNTPGNHERAGLWWAVRDTLFDMGIPTAVISPTTRAKYATGKGGGKLAAKPRVHAAARGLWPTLTLRTSDEADALLIAAITARVAGRPFDAPPGPERFSPVNGIRIAADDL